MAGQNSEIRQDESAAERQQARVLRFDRSAIVAHREGPSGGLIVRGNIRRTGVLDYRLPDGSVRKELCHPDEVFHNDSRESFAGAPITEGHPGKVHPGNWSDHAVGHMQGKPQRDGSFLSGDLHIQDGGTIDKIKSGELKEISCGYDCSLDPTPGEYNGEKYDAIQRNVRGNHVALGPRGWGRAGPEVSLHSDGGVSEMAEGEPESTAPEARTDAQKPTPTFPSMTPEEKAAYDKLQADLKLANEQIAKMNQDAADLATTKAALAKAEAEKRQLEAHVADQTSEAAKRQDAAKQEAKVAEMVDLRETARKVFGSSKDAEALAWKADGKSADDIRRDVMKFLQPDFVLTNKDGTPFDGTTLGAIFANEIERHEKVQAARHDAAAAAGGERIVEDASKRGAGAADDEDMDCDAARDAMVKDAASRFVPASMRDERRNNGGRDGAGKMVS